MKVLVIVPWAPSKIRPRSLGLIEQLSNQYDVHVVGAVWSQAEETDLKNLAVSRVTAVRLSKWGALWRSLKGLLAGRSLQQSFLDSPKFRRALSWEANDFRPDIAYFNVIRTAQFADEFHNVTKVIDLDEFRSKYYDQMMVQSRNVLWRFIATLESQRLRSAEQHVLRDFDRVIVSSPSDMAPNLSKLALVRSPHLVHSAGSSESPRQRDTIVFVGRQDYRANYEALEWFVKNVLPLVQKEFPRVKLLVVGDKPTKQTLQLASDAVEITGRVPEVSKYYETAAISIVPVSMATGVQMKLIESLTVGTPAVVTPQVAAAAGVEDACHCLVGTTPEEWAEAIKRLMSDKQLWDMLSAQGKKWAVSNHSDLAVRNAFQASFAEFVGQD